jgi:hypothetical protein
MLLASIGDVVGVDFRGALQRFLDHQPDIRARHWAST